jgi:hypothetical protein
MRNVSNNMWLNGTTLQESMYLGKDLILVAVSLLWCAVCALLLLLLVVAAVQAVTLAFLIVCITLLPKNALTAC